jgi:hypothetical protein
MNYAGEMGSGIMVYTECPQKCTHSLNDNNVVFMNISLMVDITEH